MTTEFISGGYFIVRRAERPEYLSLMVPRTFITLSSCFTDIAPDLWAVDWENYSLEERAEEAARFGIPSSMIPGLVGWTTPRVKFPFGFSSIENAQEFYKLFRCTQVAIVVGIGLHISLLTSFKSQVDKDSNRGLGLLERLEHSEPLAVGGVTLGYEPLGFDAMHFHSWLCNFSPEEIAEQLDIRTNENGLLSSLVDGKRTTEFARGHDAESAIWEPWLVASYPT
jgi:hypothetical protein